METLAGPIAAAAGDCEPVTAVGAAGMLREIGRRLGIADDGAHTVKTRAASLLAARLDGAVRASTDRLIAIYGLGGRAGAEVLSRMATGIALDAPGARPRQHLGGVGAGALSGLAADLATGGLTFGAGMLAGACSARSAARASRAASIWRGATGPVVRWDDASLSGLVAASLLRYLAVAHYGRGRGDWAQGESPPHWPAVVAEALAA